MSEGPNNPPPPGQQPGNQQGGAQPPGGQPPGGQPPPPGQQPPGQQQPPQAPQAPQQPAVGVGQPADLQTRFLAKLIDWIALWVVMMILFAIIAAVFFSAAVGGMNVFGGGGFGFSLVTTLVSTALIVGYFSFMESNKGQTFGKMLMKIQVQRADGSTPTMEEALKRNAYLGLYIIGIIPFLGFIGGLGVLAASIYIAVTINNNATTRQGWHDEFAGGTKVVKIG